MSRVRFDQAAGQELAQTVRDIEKQTDAEIVIVVRGRSSTYAHADYLCGAILAFLGLLFALFSPFDFHTYWVPIDVVVLFVAGTYVSSRSHQVRRLFTTESFRAKAARTGAAAMFYEAGIANTLAENGVLVYLSLLERRLEVIADRGILKVVPALKWNNTLFELKDAGQKCDPDALNRALRNLGALLALYLPPTDENPNELADGPRIELK